MTRRNISELADKAGVTPRTIRYYVQEGLLPPPAGSGQKVRYGPEHYRRLLAIRELASRRLSLKEIRGILDSRAPDAPEGKDRRQPSTLDLRESLAGVRAGKPHYFRGLAIYPLCSPTPPAPGLPELLTVAEALEEDHLRIVGAEGGRVGRLQARNVSDRFVLLLGGQELHAGRRSRMIARSMLVPPGATMWIPDAAGSQSPTRVSAPPRPCPPLEGYRRAFDLPAGAFGVAAAIAGRLQVADLFGHPDLLARHWADLVSGYACEALLAPEAPPPATAEVDLLLLLASRAPLGEGHDANEMTPFDINGEAVTGSGVAHGTRPVHLALFPCHDPFAPGSDEDDGLRGSIRARMAGPARRRGLASYGPEADRTREGQGSCGGWPGGVPGGYDGATGREGP